MRERMSRPPFGSEEFLPYFKSMVTTSDRATEAAAKMGYRGPGTVRYHMKKFGIHIHAFGRDGLHSVWPCRVIFPAS